MPEDSRKIAELICMANSNALFELMPVVDLGLMPVDIIERMLTSGLGYAHTGNAILAESGGEVIGMIFIVPPDRYDYSTCDVPPEWESAYGSFFNTQFNDPDSYCIHSFAVRREFQRKGIGKTLLALSKTRVKELGGRKIIVGTGEGNAQSHGAHETAGFKVVGSELMVGMDILECVL